VWYPAKHYRRQTGLESEIDVETTFSTDVLMDLATCKLSLKNVGFFYGFHALSRTINRDKIGRLIQNALWISCL
jgi:hypothetical protein